MTLITTNLIRFIFGGNSLFTITKNDKEFSYKVYKKKTSDNAKIYVCCLKYSNKNIYCGYFKVVGNRLRYIHNEQKNKIARNDERVLLLLEVIHNRNNLDPSIKIYHCGRCGHCGRQLTDTQSIARGFGPDCWKKVKGFLES